MAVSTRRGILAWVASIAAGFAPRGASASCPADPECDLCGGIQFRGIPGTCETDADCAAGCRCGPSAGTFFRDFRPPHNPTKKEYRRFRNRQRRKGRTEKLFCEPVAPADRKHATGGVSTLSVAV